MKMQKRQQSSQKPSNPTVSLRRTHLVSIPMPSQTFLHRFPSCKTTSMIMSDPPMSIFPPYTHRKQCSPITTTGVDPPLPTTIVTLPPFATWYSLLPVTTLLHMDILSCLMTVIGHKTFVLLLLVARLHHIRLHLLQLFALTPKLPMILLLHE